MSLTLQLTPAEEAKLLAKARADGTPPEQVVRAAIEPILASVAETVPPATAPNKSLSGIWSQYGPGSSEEDIDQNRAEMFSTFGSRRHRMIVAVADTHAVVRYLFKNPNLSADARHVIEEVFRAGDHIGVSSISLAEMVYLSEKGRIPLTVCDQQRREDSGVENPDDLVELG